MNNYQPILNRTDWIWRRRGVHAIPFGTGGLGHADERNRYVYFRRTFTVDGSVEAANVFVSADGRYQLFVNGRLVGRGPARNHPAHQQADPYNLAPYLQPGRNVIAALVHSYGRETAWYELPHWEQSRAFGSGGFYLQGDLTWAGEQGSGDQRSLGAGEICLDTGAAWRCLESEAWQRDVPSGSLGFIEIYDARRAPQGWTEADFDDSGWGEAEVLRVPGRNFVNDIVPFPNLRPRDIPHLFEEIRRPTAVLTIAEVKNAPPAADIATLFEQETLLPLAHCQGDGLDTVLSEEGTAVLTTTPQHSVTFVIDFGRTVTGRLRFDVDGAAGTILDFTHSERLHEDGRVHIHAGIPSFDIKQAHRLILHDGRQTWEAFEWAGFRYVQVTVRHPISNPQSLISNLQIHSIAINHTGYPVQERGQFACSDERLNRVWQVGRNTLRLCMHDAYIDCPSREQRQWMGDGYVEMLINFAAFGDTALAARLLRQIAQSQLADGLTMMCAPGDFAVKRFINIPDFTLYWLMALEKYTLYSGDATLTRELYPAAARAIGWFEQYLNADDLLADVPHWIFH
ncbi:MAG: family 78 glycoside hydrolase catalytic domain [Ardenticatenaceae bacterium]|nr:family 78 glycoside hydrolase catalytic domain [Ardenticatenaceae bacterium]